VALLGQTRHLTDLQTNLVGGWSYEPTRRDANNTSDHCAQSITKTVQIIYNFWCRGGTWSGLRNVWAKYHSANKMGRPGSVGL